VRRKTVSGIMLTLLLIGMLLTLAFNIQPVKSDWTWTETIYIRADGSFEPDTAPISTVDNITYTLTDNIVGDVPELSNAIVVERDNIVVDGVGYALQGTGTSDSKGISLDVRSNVTIKNTEIKAFDRGIYVYGSSNNTISGNTITNNVDGIWLSHSSNNSILGNNIANNDDYGIAPYFSSNNSILGNNIANNGGGIVLSSSNGSIFTGNTISDSYVGIGIERGQNNVIYNNNFINNEIQVFLYKKSSNTWDNEYPSGGNYWSDHVCTGNPSDGSQPYIIDADNVDHYPFQDPNGWLLPPPEPVGGKATPINISMNKPEMPTLWIWLTTIILSLALIVVYVRKRKRNPKISS
jgi:parallel beta-helix repeat protein